MFLTDDSLHNYKRCQRRAFLDLYGDYREKSGERDFLRKIHQESQKHLQEVISDFEYINVKATKIDINEKEVSSYQQEKINITEALMAQGVEVIYQGIITCNNIEDILIPEKNTKNILNSFPEGITFIGYPTLLIKIPGKSKFGDWLYFPINIKFGGRPKSEYKLIGAFHAWILSKIQGVLSPHSTLILRNKKQYNINLDNWLIPLEEIINNFLEMSAQKIEPEVFISRQRCGLCFWYNHCYKIAQNQNHLSLIPGITPKRYLQLQHLKINTVESLSKLSPTILGEYLGGKVALQLQQQAESIVTNKALLKPKYNKYKFKIPTNDIEIYFDIEAEPDISLDYLLGALLINRKEKTQKFYPFLAEKIEDEGKIWQDFLDFLNQYPQAPIFHFSDYEKDTINRLSALYKTDNKERLKILERCVDLHHIVIHSVTAPVENYSLKSLGNWLGFQWHNHGVSGDQCVWWYDQWLKKGDRKFLDLILRYNEDDCLATFHLKNWLADFLKS